MAFYHIWYLVLEKFGCSKIICEFFWRLPMNYMGYYLILSENYRALNERYIAQLRNSNNWKIDRYPTEKLVDFVKHYFTTF